MARSNKTFGFRNLNGAAFQVEIISGAEGNYIPNLEAVDRIAELAIKSMNKHGKRAEKIAKNPQHSPYKRGWLVRSIKWMKASQGKKVGRVITGHLEVGVPYGRRLEFEHETKSRYLQRALDQVFPEFVAEMSKKNVLGAALFGRTRQQTVDGVQGGFFSG